MPLVTRVWCTAIFVCGGLDYFGFVSNYKFLFNASKVWDLSHHELWRLVTTFTYFGPLSFNLFLYIYLISRYSTYLEESFAPRRRAANYAWLLFLACSMLIALASFFVHLTHLGPYLNICIVYVWARRHPDVRVPFMGLFVFSAPYLPWALAIYGLVVSEQSDFIGELIGIAVGHVIFFFEDIYPTINGGKRPLAPPWEWRRSPQVAARRTR